MYVKIFAFVLNKTVKLKYLRSENVKNIKTKCPK